MEFLTGLPIPDLKGDGRNARSQVWTLEQAEREHFESFEGHRLGDRRPLWCGSTTRGEAHLTALENAPARYLPPED